MLVALLLSSAVLANKENKDEKEEVSGLLTAEPTIADQQYYLSPPDLDKKSEYAHYFNQPDPPQVSVEQVVPSHAKSFLYQRLHKEDYRSTGESSPETSSEIQPSTLGPISKGFDLESILALRDLRKPTQNPGKGASDSKSNQKYDDLIDILPPLIDQEPNYYVTKHNEERKKFKKNQEKKAENHDGVDKPKVIKKSSKYRKIEKVPKIEPEPLLSNERVEFQMHGHLGPKSYRFGYDTGSGNNRLATSQVVE